ncbi:MAG: PorT family protein [Paludibacteraceae bacterium]|nr:PorT family protein [Paludibacteraceae bacterium]
MKKIVFALATLLLFTSNIFAEKDVKVRFGLEGGFNMTKWNGDLMPDYSVSPDMISATANINDASVRPGFHAGALMDIIIEKHWSIQPEVLFQLEGSTIESPIVVPTFDEEGEYIGDVVADTLKEKFTAGYIRIPVVLYYNIMNVGPGQLSPGLGVYFAGGVCGKSDKKVGDEVRNTFGVGGVLDEFDWGPTVKVGYEFQSVANGLYLNLGFSQGLTTSKTTGLNFTVGYKFQYWKGIKRAYNTGILEYNP